MNKINIPFNKPFLVGKELFYIAQAVMSGKLSGDGYFTKKCHAWIEEKLACKKVLLTPSCTAALEMSAYLCDLQPGDEVIMPSFTFSSTATAFVSRGAVPVFVDIHSDTLNFDEKMLSSALSERTKVIVPVHYAGISCKMNEICAFANKHSLVVVEDAAQGFLSQYEEKFLGTIGNLGCLSFHETKNIISGEGGALLINDERFFDRSEIIREKGTNRSKFFRGQVDKYTWVDVGSSYLPSELVGAFLFAQLEQSCNIIASRIKIFQRYKDGLFDLEKEGLISTPKQPNNCLSNGHIFYILANDSATQERLLQHLRNHGILAVFHFVPLHSSPAGRRYGRTVGLMETTNSISSRIIRLPLYYEMNVEDIEFVILVIKQFFGYAGKK